MNTPNTMPPPNDDFVIRFWGVRGSVPSPGPHTARYGGNTSCVSVEGINVVDGKPYVGIFDAGTGIRALGKKLLAVDADLVLLLSHIHWDHIQGFPFFEPIYQEKSHIYFATIEHRYSLFRRLLEQMDGTHFPLTEYQLRAQLRPYAEDQLQQFAREGYRIRRVRVNHPGEAYGFRADLRGRSIVYVPDNELDPPYHPPHISPDEMIAFCQDADILIHDAQYLPRDMPRKRGWGHSVIDRVRELARDANVRHLVLFHHDPDRTDDELDAIGVESAQWFAANAPQISCTVAYEGLELRLPG